MYIHYMRTTCTYTTTTCEEPNAAPYMRSSRLPPPPPPQMKRDDITIVSQLEEQIDHICYLEHLSAAKAGTSVLDLLDRTKDLSAGSIPPPLHAVDSIEIYDRNVPLVIDCGIYERNEPRHAPVDSQKKPSCHHRISGDSRVIVPSTIPLVLFFFNTHLVSRTHTSSS
eukprot:GHVS01029817.1.p1 GENE.GHVS01029817.1~~GHVS01029817.1.p1  ORF type:complete len:168 (-),score=21.77 GHVS01029817.1:307-810(-)